LMWARSTKGSSKMMRLLPRHVEDASSGDLQSAPGGRSRWFGETMGGEIPPFAASSRGSFRRRRETFPDGSIPLQSNVIREEPHPAAHKPFDAEKARRVRVRSDARVTSAHSQTHVNTYMHKRTSSRSERESEREGGNERGVQVGRANGLLLHHAGTRPFRAPMHTRCRRTSMPTGVDNRLAQGWIGYYI
jgi:hypothetical protein